MVGRRAAPEPARLDAELAERARQVRLVVFDVDGVLTDGRLYYGSDGEVMKAFHVQDGAALKLLQRHGIEIALITGRESGMVRSRAAELGIVHVCQGVSDKWASFKALRSEQPTLAAIALEHCACVGDDLADLALFQRLGFSISVADGHPSARRAAHWVTEARGGTGVAREVSELLLRAQGIWSYP